VIAFDMVFSEPDRMSPHNIAETIPNMSSNLKDGLKSLPSNDQILAEAVAKYRVVLGQAGRWVQDEGLRVAPHAERTAFATKGENPVRFLERF
jgi:adenylate cyclase